MLYPHQIELANKAYQILQKYHIVYLAMEMRVGKTLIALETAKLIGAKNVIFITKKKAINSILEDFNREDYNYSLTVINFEQAEKYKPVYDLVVVDEAHCFLGDTIIDGCRIDKIVPGDFVNSYNHEKDIIEKKKVIRVFKNKTGGTLLRLCIGEEVLICTKQHKFFVIGKGYITAENLKIGDYFYEHNNLQNLPKRNNNRQQTIQNKQQSSKKRDGMLFGRMFTQMATYSIFDKKTPNNRINLRYMWNRDKRVWEKLSKKNKREYPNMFSLLCVPSQKSTHKGRRYRSIQKGKLIKNDQSQPYVKSRNKRKSVPNIEENRAQTQNQRWKRSYPKVCGDIMAKIRGQFYFRTSNNYPKRNEGQIPNPKRIQSGFSKSSKQNSDRSGWEKPQLIIGERKGSTKNNGIKVVRLEGIADYEQRNTEQYVYNLEVEGNNNYFANSILVHNCCGAYPKPSKRTLAIKKLVGMNPLILASGTPSPESETQLFHQVSVSYYNPFNIDNFYKWAKMYVNVKEVVRNGYRLNDYSSAKRADIMRVLDPIFLTYTRAQAGFSQADVIEEIIDVPIDPNIEKLVQKIMTDRFFLFKDDQKIICDSAVKLQSKIHQIFSGTVKTEEGNEKILDKSKANFILRNYQGKKIAIFYKFVAEGRAIKETIPNWTDSPEEFNQSEDKVFVCQIASGSMGVNLSTADILIFYNIDFSSVQYWQARARLQTMNRDKPAVVHWLFSQNGIEKKIYNVVLKKKDYTLYYFMKDFGNGIKDSSKDYSTFETNRSIYNQNHSNKSQRRA